jgi:O-antigen ligase
MGGDSPFIPDRIAGAVLLALAVWCVWRPVETFPSTAVLVAAVVLGMAVWGWRRTPLRSNAWLASGTATCLLGASGLTGWDPSSAVIEIALLGAVVMLVWLASRVSPPNRWPALLALAISGLTLWALWQVCVGIDLAAAAVPSLPEGIQAPAADRLASGRAFASQLLPSHLAVLLATALPLLLVRLKRSRSSFVWGVGVALCTVGLFLTKSPIGAALAVAACVALALRRKRRLLVWVSLLLVAVLVIVAVAREDVRNLEPVQLRVDNWRTAAWVWSQAPAAGVGIGGFGQAAQGVPFEVGNYPRHAHSLPLEWLAELGPIGLLAILFGVAALTRLLWKLWPERPELAIAVAVIPIHNLVDFSLYGSGVALAWAILLGWSMACVRTVPANAVSPARGRVVFVTTVATVFAATSLHVTSIKVEESVVAKDTATERMDAAYTAAQLAPWRVDPAAPYAAAALETADPNHISTASELLQRRRWLRPRSSAFASLRARLAIAANQAPTALAEAWTAASGETHREVHSENFELLLEKLEIGGDDVTP